MTTPTRTRPTEPLRLEHRELLPEIHALRDLADTIGLAERDEVIAGAREARLFLTHHLVPHAQAEDAVLYAAVEAAMGAPGATDTMRRDHVEVVRFVEELERELTRLEAGDGTAGRRLRAILYGLEAIVALHFAKEEEIYLEVLDRALDERSAHELFERLETAAAEAKSGVHATIAA